MATGAELDAATGTDFVERLRYDCNGAGVNGNGTQVTPARAIAKAIE